MVKPKRADVAAKPPGQRAKTHAGGRDALGYTRPQTYEELRAVLSSGTTHFPKRLREVAIFLWQHPGDVALGTIGQVAEKAGVQPSTLVPLFPDVWLQRFLGFPGPLQGSYQGFLAGRTSRRQCRST